jgi:membrane-bound lytic murein transglycosylase B
MLRKSIIVIAMLSLLMTAALAQSTQKRTPSRKAGIWGIETDFGANVKKTRPNNFSRGTANPTTTRSKQRRVQPPRPQMNQADTKPTESMSLNFNRRAKPRARVKR